MGPSTERVRQYYAEAGVTPEQDLADHIANELRFVAHLWQVEASAAAPGSVDAAGRRARFVSEHLLQWLGDLRDRVREGSDSGFYSAALEAAEMLLREEPGLVAPEPPGAARVEPVLYECLTRRPAFQGDTVSDLVVAILRSEPDWSLLPPATPLGLRELLARCLRKDARSRLRDIGDARVTLEELGGAIAAPDAMSLADRAPARSPRDRGGASGHGPWPPPSATTCRASRTCSAPRWA